MNTLNAKYSTLKTLRTNGYDFSDFAGHMEFFGYTIREDNAKDCVEVIDPETNEAIDFAHPIIITRNGQRFYELLSCEMESTLNLDGEWISTITTDIETSGYPTMIRKALRK